MLAEIAKWLNVRASEVRGLVPSQVRILLSAVTHTSAQYAS